MGGNFLNTKNIDKNLNKRKKDICFYCIFKEKEKTFQEQINIIFKEYIDNLKINN